MLLTYWRLGKYLHYFHMTNLAENYIYYVELDEDYEYVKKNPLWTLFRPKNKNLIFVFTFLCLKNNIYFEFSITFYNI